MSSKRKSKKTKQHFSSDSSSDDEDLQPIHFFVPGEHIDAEVLVYHITKFVDNTARITSSRHPTDKSRTGFNVTANKTLNATSLRDLINDSRDWDTESQSKSFRRNPYRYADSDTAKRRARQGASKGGTVRPDRQGREAVGCASEKIIDPRGVSRIPTADAPDTPVSKTSYSYTATSATPDYSAYRVHDSVPAMAYQQSAYGQYVPTSPPYGTDSRSNPYNAPRPTNDMTNPARGQDRRGRDGADQGRDDGARHSHDSPDDKDGRVPPARRAPPSGRRIEDTGPPRRSVDPRKG